MSTRPPAMAASLKEQMYDQDLLEAHLLEKRGLTTLFPAMFTMLTMMLFSAPAYVVLSVGHSKVVAYWMSRFFYAVYIIPVIILVTHFHHKRKNGPSKPAVIFALIVPSLILLLCANGQMIQAIQSSGKLFSIDCDTFPGKRQLQQSWEAADDLWQTCLEETSASSGVDIKTLKEKFKIQDCEEYSTELVKHKEDWEYLRYLEEEHACSGWCATGTQLWSGKVSKDSCSSTVSIIFRHSVKTLALQVVIAMVCTLLGTALALILLGPVLRKHGVPW